MHISHGESRRKTSVPVGPLSQGVLSSLSPPQKMCRHVRLFSYASRGKSRSKSRSKIWKINQKHYLCTIKYTNLQAFHSSSSSKKIKIFTTSSKRKQSNVASKNSYLITLLVKVSVSLKQSCSVMFYCIETAAVVDTQVCDAAVRLAFRNTTQLTFI